MSPAAKGKRQVVLTLSTEAYEKLWEPCEWMATPPNPVQDNLEVACGWWPLLPYHLHFVSLSLAFSSLPF